jgi:hypothetical protein
MGEKEKEKPDYNLADFKVGWRVDGGPKIKRIYVKTAEYVIYGTKRGVKYYIADEHLPKDKRIYFKRLLEIGPELDKVISLQPKSVKSVESINKQVARSMCQGFEDKIEAAKDLLVDAKERLIRLRCLQGRLHYFFSAFVLALAPFAFLLSIKFFNFFSGIPGIEIYAKIMTFGALGGFLSVSLNVWQLEIDLDATRRFNFAAGCSRIFISIAAAIFVYYAIKAKLILGTLEENDFGTYVAAIVAGFSESFVPNIIGKISKEEEMQINSATCKP